MAPLRPWWSAWRQAASTREREGGYVILETMRERHTEYHKDGSIRAQGDMVDGTPDGYWEWFRLDGTRMRSGYFDHGSQVGDWITYDRRGDVYKVTTMRAPKGSSQ
jgi:antitoxin component YwqK of YwqJK toxin-antitoxin module